MLRKVNYDKLWVFRVLYEVCLRALQRMLDGTLQVLGHKTLQINLLSQFLLNLNGLLFWNLRLLRTLMLISINSRPESRGIGPRVESLKHRWLNLLNLDLDLVLYLRELS